MNKELDSLFEFKEDDKTVEKVIKDAKNRSTTRIVSISLAVWVGAIALLSILLVQIAPLMLEKHVIDSTIYHKLFGANMHMGEWKEEYKLIGSTAQAKRYKIIEGAVVAVGSIQEPMKNWSTPKLIRTPQGVWYTDEGQRVMQFYHPEAAYTSYNNDFDEIKQLEEGQVVEVALSFDQAYTDDEMKTFLGDQTQLNWGWIAYQPPTDEKVYSAYDVLGMHYLEDNGEVMENPQEKFINLIEIGLVNGKESQSIIENIENDLKGEDDLLTGDDLRFNGCVVTGTKEAVLALKDLEAIKTVSLGDKS